jgi:hypothetical protein
MVSTPADPPIGGNPEQDRYKSITRYYTSMVQYPHQMFISMRGRMKKNKVFSDFFAAYCRNEL